jgi:uncharacterized protein involved in exopolysaccharide biosynthesis
MMAKSQDELLSAETDLAEQQARVKEIKALLSGRDPSQSKAQNTPQSFDTPVNRETRDSYEVVTAKIGQFRKTEMDLLSRYTPENPMVTAVQNQLRQLERQRREMEAASPSLLSTAITAAGSPERPQADLVEEQSKLAALTARVEALTGQLHGIQDRASKLADVGTQITQLERRKELEEADSKYFESSLERARIDEALDPSKMPNISIVQKPSLALKISERKPLMTLAGGGVGAGLAIAFLIELFFDRSVKRKSEFEGRLGVPLILAIPYSRSGRRLKRSRWQNRNAADRQIEKGDQVNLAPWETDHFIRSYAEAIRDRLILSFQL